MFCRGDLCVRLDTWTDDRKISSLLAMAAAISLDAVVDGRHGRLFRPKIGRIKSTEKPTLLF